MKNNYKPSYLLHFYCSTHNLPSFRACSQIVSSLSGYQYTRKTWKRDVFELMMDASFFQMDSSCIEFWRIIVDNLMTHDKVTFKDLISKISEYINII